MASEGRNERSLKQFTYFQIRVEDFQMVRMASERVQVKEALCNLYGFNELQMRGEFGFYNTKRQPHAGPERSGGIPFSIIVRPSLQTHRWGLPSFYG